MYYRYFLGFTNPAGASRTGRSSPWSGTNSCYAFPSDAGTTCVALSVNLGDFAAMHHDAERVFHERLAAHPGLAPRLARCTTDGRLLGCGPKDHLVRVPGGAGVGARRRRLAAPGPVDRQRHGQRGCPRHVPRRCDRRLALRPRARRGGVRPVPRASRRARAWPTSARPSSSAAISVSSRTPDTLTASWAPSHRKRNAGSSASGRPARTSPGSPTSDSSPSSTAARNRPASRSATATTSSSTRTSGSSARSSTKPR